MKIIKKKTINIQLIQKHTTLKPFFGFCDIWGF